MMRQTGLRKEGKRTRKGERPKKQVKRLKTKLKIVEEGVKVMAPPTAVALPKLPHLLSTLRVTRGPIPSQYVKLYDSRSLGWLTQRAGVGEVFNILV